MPTTATTRTNDNDDDTEKEHYYEGIHPYFHLNLLCKVKFRHIKHKVPCHFLQRYFKVTGSGSGNSRFDFLQKLSLEVFQAPHIHPLIMPSSSASDGWHLYVTDDPAPLSILIKSRPEDESLMLVLFHKGLFANSICVRDMKAPVLTDGFGCRKYIQLPNTEAVLQVACIMHHYNKERITGEQAEECLDLLFHKATSASQIRSATRKITESEAILDAEEWGVGGPAARDALVYAQLLKGCNKDFFNFMHRVKVLGQSFGVRPQDVLFVECSSHDEGGIWGVRPSLTEMHKLLLGFSGHGGGLNIVEAKALVTRYGQNILGEAITASFFAISGFRNISDFRTFAHHSMEPLFSAVFREEDEDGYDVV